MTEMMADDICLTEVTKIFHTGVWKRKVGVQNLTLQIPKGEVVGLLGANGSGKSTTIKMLLGFLKPTSGELLVCGHQAGTREARRLIGYLPENPRFQRFMRGRELLRYFGRLLSLRGNELEKRIDLLLELVGLGNAGSERVQGYSKGMTQRLAIAQSLLNQPRLLVFDEPMSGLDPLGRMEIRRLIQRIHAEMPDSTIFFSTHILADAEELCSSIALLKRGVLTNHCATNELLATDRERFHLVANGLPDSLRDRFQSERAGKATPLGLGFEIEGTESMIECLEEIRKAGAKVISLTSQRNRLEEALFGDVPAAAQSMGRERT